MGARFSLEGGMIPRTVKRMFDERSEARIEAELQTAVLSFRGQDHVVHLVNVSSAGAMVIFPGMPHIGEAVSLQILGRDAIAGQVMWVREGRVGLNFAAPLE